MLDKKDSTNSISVKKAKAFALVCKNIAADKSISHRCAIFSLLSDKTSYISNYLMAEDTLNTLSIVEQLGADIKKENNTIAITPPEKLQEPSDVLDCGNSGTSMRLFCGFLSSIDGAFVLSGDKYLRQRPMKRVANPLRSIGAKIDGREKGNKAPLFIRGGKLKAFSYRSPIDSAQVKSAMILSALRADGVCRYKENRLSRDHTERMLEGMGADIKSNQQQEIEIHPLQKPLEPLSMTVPSDPSSGFFFAVAAAVIPGSSVTLKNISLNPTRVESYKVLKKMGVDVQFIEKENLYEPIGDIVVRHGSLNGVVVEENIAWLIDELPALSIAMAVAKGKSVVKNAKELRVKESDRIKSVVDNLKLCSIEVNEKDDGYEIAGNGSFKEAVIDSHGDHRIAMSFAIAGLLSGMKINDTECIMTSFPNFVDILQQITEVNG